MEIPWKIQQPLGDRVIQHHVKANAQLAEEPLFGGMATIQFMVVLGMVEKLTSTIL